MFKNLSYIIDKLQNISLVINMLQLLYAPSIMNQTYVIEMTFVILHLERLRLGIFYVLPCILKTLFVWKLFSFTMDMLVTC